MFSTISVLLRAIAATRRGQRRPSVGAWRTSPAWATAGGVADCLEDLAATASERGHAELGARLFEAADALREAAGTPRDPATHPVYERITAAARATLGPHAFAAAHAAGRGLPLDRAVADALALAAALGRAEPGPAPPVAPETAGQPSR
jgi:hypothetical protein